MMIPVILYQTFTVLQRILHILLFLPNSDSAALFVEFIYSVPLFMCVTLDMSRHRCSNTCNRV